MFVPRSSVRVSRYRLASSAPNLGSSRHPVRPMSLDPVLMSPDAALASMTFELPTVDSIGPNLLRSLHRVTRRVNNVDRT